MKQEPGPRLELTTTEPSAEDYRGGKAMGFLTGMMLIDAPASALNNSDAEPSERADNKIPVKRIRTRAGDYPYVSAQAVRYWLRTYLERSGTGWKAAPVAREAKIAYTDADPIECGMMICSGTCGRPQRERMQQPVPTNLS
jgi:hypothetical protein